jgi:hypothetical protein
MNTLIYILISFISSIFFQEPKNYYCPVTIQQHYFKEAGNYAFKLNNYNYVGLSTNEFDSLTGALFVHLTYYSKSNNWEKQILSKEDFSWGIYEDTLLFYKNNHTNKQVFIWKQEGEYYSYLYIYLLEKNKLLSLGDLCLGVDCKNCDVFNFPNNEIEIYEFHNEISIVFKKPSIFRGSEALGFPYYSVAIKVDKLVLVYNGINSRITIL